MTSNKKAIIEIFGWVFIGWLICVFLYLFFSFLYFENLFNYENTSWVGQNVFDGKLVKRSLNFWPVTRLFMIIGFIVGTIRAALIIKHRK